MNSQPSNVQQNSKDAEERIEETRPLEHQKLPLLYETSETVSKKDLEPFVGFKVTNVYHKRNISGSGQDLVNKSNKSDLGRNLARTTEEPKQTFEKPEVSSHQTRNCYMNLRRKCHRKQTSMERSPIRREKSRDMCRPLKQWLYSHRDSPYPSRSEKLELSMQSNLTLTQVSNWFANARRRLKNTVAGPPGITWSRRMKLYNRHVIGNQELLSISSDGDNSSKDEDDDDDDEWGEGGVKEEPRDMGRQIENISNNNSDEKNSQLSLQHKHSQLSVVDTNGDRSSQSNETKQTSPQEHFVRKSSCPAQSKVGTGSVSAKVKQSIIQRYLNDTMALGGNESNSKPVRDGLVQRQKDIINSDRLVLRSLDFRHRNASGSLSSHDYEEISISSRSTPTKDQCFVDGPTDEEHTRPFNTIGKDFHWKEISAALGLTLLANCVQKVPNEMFYC